MSPRMRMSRAGPRSLPFTLLPSQTQDFIYFIFYFYKFIYFIYVFLAALGLCCGFL